MPQNPDQAAMFPSLPAAKLREMCAEGGEMVLEDRQVIFSEGETDYAFYVVLEGRIRVTKRIAGEEVLLIVHEKGGITGDISILMGAPAIATGSADGPARVVRFSNSQLRRMIAECPSLAEPVLRAFVARAHELGAGMIQQEKLASLGKMAANLAHELNNPAAAMVRTVQSLRGAISRVAKMGIQYDCRFSATDRPALDKIQQFVHDNTSDPETLSPLERSDREEGLSAWLEERGIDDAWERAPGLVGAGITRECLTGLSGTLSADALIAALTWLEADLTTSQLAAELESASCRISDLVLAMKQFTYMDQARFQEIDLHQGLDSTLKIFSHRTRAGVEVRRDYDKSIPKIPAYAGELNQVWANLISNALDAMNGAGVLTVSTRLAGGEAVVAIGDTGSGIPPEIRDHIFDPFVTSKPAGSGTGLGLETAQRVVVNRHQGKISVESKPGDTRFEVRLPIKQRKDHEMYSPQTGPGNDARTPREGV